MHGEGCGKEKNPSRLDQNGTSSVDEATDCDRETRSSTGGHTTLVIVSVN